MQDDWPRGEEERRITTPMVLVALGVAAIVLLLLLQFYSHG
jgi:hypothetical protein